MDFGRFGMTDFATTSTRTNTCNPSRSMPDPVPIHLQVEVTDAAIVDLAKA